MDRAVCWSRWAARVAGTILACVDTIPSPQFESYAAREQTDAVFRNLTKLLELTPVLPALFFGNPEFWGYPATEILLPAYFFFPRAQSPFETLAFKGSCANFSELQEWLQHVGASNFAGKMDSCPAGRLTTNSTNEKWNLDEFVGRVFGPQLATKEKPGNAHADWLWAAVEAGQLREFLRGKTSQAKAALVRAHLHLLNRFLETTTITPGD